MEALVAAGLVFFTFVILGRLVQFIRNKNDEHLENNNDMSEEELEIEGKSTGDDE